MAQGLIETLNAGHELKVVAPEEVAQHIDETVAVTLITEVDYRTGRRHNMADLTQRAHAAGALTIWDLAHSAGAVDLDRPDTQPDPDQPPPRNGQDPKWSRPLRHGRVGSNRPYRGGGLCGNQLR